MKKTLSLLLVLLIAFSMVAACLITTASAAATGTVKLSSGTMRVRKTASTSASVVDTLRNGDKVSVLSKTTKSGVLWYKVTTPSNKTGYVQAKYITLGSSSSSSTGSSGTTTSGTTATVKVTKMKIYKSKSSSSTLLATAKKGETVTVLSLTSSSSWAQVKYGSVTGYCAKSSLNTTSTGTSTGGNGTVKPAFVSLTKPTYTTCSTEAQVLETINYHLSQFESSFSFKVNTTNTTTISRLLPKQSELRYAYLLTTKEAKAQKVDPITYYVNGSTVSVTARYNAAGLVLQHYKNGTTLTDSKAIALKSKVESILKSETSTSMSDYDKALALHDYIVLNAGYDSSDISYTAYGALVEGKASCQGYAEATCLLYTLAGLENHFVRSDSLVNVGGTHGYTKVKIDGVWYCVDTTGDDPRPDKAGRVRHDFFLTSDEIMEQRYTPWNSSYYPAATKMTMNYYVKNDLVVSSTSELQAKVKAATNAKKSSLEVWVDDYSSGNYSLAKIKAALTNGASCSVYSLGSSGIERCTIYITFEY